jgi:hypothetical protein
MAIITQEGYHDFLLDGKKTTIKVSNNILCDQDNVVGARMFTALMTSPIEIKTVERAKRALLEKRFTKDGEDYEYYFIVCRGAVGGKKVYQISPFKATNNWQEGKLEHRDKIPRLTDEQVAERASVCRQLHLPALRRASHLIATLPTNYYGEAFTMDVRERKVRWVSPEEKLKKVGTYPTFHTYGYVGIFKPSVGEVLSQLPASLFENNSKRYLIETEMFSGNPNVVDMGEYHLGVTTVYLDPDVVSSYEPPKKRAKK